jgi:hypothetical protein
MNSGVFDTVLDFHIKSLAEQLKKELSQGRGVVFNTIVILLLLRLSPFVKLNKMQGLHDILNNIKQEHEGDRHFE